MICDDVSNSNARKAVGTVSLIGSPVCPDIFASDKSAVKLAMIAALIRWFVANTPFRKTLHIEDLSFCSARGNNQMDTFEIVW